MRRIFLVVSLALLSPAAVAAVGSGGGGGGSSDSSACTADTYSCQAWSNCQGGARSRLCVLSVDCPNVDTPKPITEESCGARCAADTWRCDDWTVCASDGTQQRTCAMSFDCSEAETPSPVLSQKCLSPTERSAGQTGLRCGNFASLAERVRCRLKLTAAEINHELDIQYLPEECRPLESAVQEACVARYRSLAPCWEKPLGGLRATCAATALGVKKSVAADWLACRPILNKLKRATCSRQVRDKAYGLIKFRFYDLAERAEDLKDKGVAVGKISGVVTTMEQLKQDFNVAKNYAARRAIILRARVAWNKFVAANKIKGHNNDYLAGALLDLATVK